MNRCGSITFGTSNIRTDEYLIAAKVIIDNGETIKEAKCTLSAWDDILGLIKIRSIIVGQSFTKTGRVRKDATLSSIIDGRIDLLVEELKQIKNDTSS